MHGVHCTKTAVVAVLLLSMTVPGLAQSSFTNAGNNWSGSYGFPSASERNVRLNHLVEQERINSGYYQPQSVTNNYNYDHSVGDISVSAAEGASVEVSNRTADGTGTNSYVVGSINNSTNNITTEGSGNSIDISNSSQSQGCQDGSISSASMPTMGGLDISAASSQSATISSGGQNC